MRILASFVMRGRSQAVMATTVLGMLSLILPPVSILSSAVVALVTLRLGEREGVLTGLLAAVACGLLGTIALGNALPVVGLALLSWMPIWLLATMLRNSRSLSLTVQSGLVFGLALIAMYQMQFPDPVAEWRRLLEPVSQSLVQSELLDEAGRVRLLDTLARWMTGVLAAGFFLQLTLSLFLGRWWQALLYNPGGFREEFRGLRASRALGYLTLVLLVALFGLSAEWGPVRYLLVLLFALYFLQGLAVVHTMVAQAGAGVGWLIGVYALLVLATYYTMSALAAAGFADTWLDIRRRAGARRGGGSDGGSNE
ncbi:MAG: hypothetical protein PVF91_05370 [Chromatiales bacterium]|jgi:hypothetical protein